MIQDVCHVVTGQISTEFDKKNIFALSTVFDYWIWKKFGIHILFVSKIKPVKTFLDGGYKGQVEYRELLPINLTRSSNSISKK